LLAISIILAAIQILIKVNIYQIVWQIYIIKYIENTNPNISTTFNHKIKYKNTTHAGCPFDIKDANQAI